MEKGVRETLAETTEALKKAGLGRSAALDAEILLTHALGLSREELIMRADEAIPAAGLRRFRSYLARRLKREPVAYIIGRKDFFGLEFKVRKGTCLIPRPDTEVLVERAIAILGEWRVESGEWDTPPSMGGAGGGCCRRPPHLSSPAAGRGTGTTIVDIGTGSGAIAVAVAKNVPDAEIFATDISAAALRLARENAEANGVADRIRFAKTDLLPKTLPPRGRLLVLANLPYVPLAEWKTLEPEVRLYEPKLALVGGNDGLSAYRRLLAMLGRLRPDGGFALLAEIHPEQYAAMAKLARKRWPKAKARRHEDLAGKTRVIEIAA